MCFKELFYPKFCLDCGMIGSYVCLNCRKKLVYIDKDRCHYCQKPSPYGLTHGRCQKKNGIDGFIAIFHYNNLLKKIVKNFKYRLVVSVWKELSLSIEPEKLLKINFYKKLTLEKKIFLQPIPLHPRKIKERGFNQAVIISKFFQQFLRLPIKDNLIRIRETKPQAQIQEIKKRRVNVKNAFKVRNREEIKDNAIILVDDLLTSGRTAEEATTVLKKAGAKTVFVLTLAKG